MTSPDPERVPSVFMLVPGPWQRPQQLVEALREHGLEAMAADDNSLSAGEIRVDIVEDDGLADGLAWGRKGPLPDELIERVAECTHAALIEFGGCLHEGVALLAKLGSALRDLGGVAIRMEASGAACEWESWLAAFQSGELARIYAHCVLMIGDEDEMFTSGMHQFDLPDAQVANMDPSEAVRWLDALCEYQLDERPCLISGHTFRPDPQSARRVLERWPDPHHGPDDGRHNPFGQWRIQLPKAARVTASDLAPTIVPSLTAQLMAAENSKGRALSKREVEAITAKATAIAMAPQDALALERSRGYADIEPELAWEQWQITREALRN